MFQYVSDIKILNNSKYHKTILLNRNSGFWIKIPNVWKNVLDNFLNSSIETDLYVQQFEDLDDANTFLQLLDTLIKYDMIEDKKNKRKSNLYKVQFAITERCNLSCIHCCYNAGMASDKTDLELNKIKKIIDKIVFCNPKSITLSGGEPLIREDFYDILKYLAEHYEGEITLSTNATLITENRILELIEKISSFDISLDGFDENSCKKIRGKGVFSKVITNIKKLQNYGASNINLSMVDINHSKEEREKFKILNKQLGTKAIIRALSPIGRATGMESKVEYLEKLYKPRLLETEEQKRICSGFRGTKCGAYRNQFFVNYNGDIYPCGLLIDSKYKTGNILEIDKDKIFPFTTSRGNGVRNLKMLEPDQIKYCKNCEVNFFCWGCLQEADMLVENPELIHERCKLKYNHLNNIIWAEE